MSRITDPILPHESVFVLKQHLHVGVSKNRGTPKWMVYNGKPYSNGWFGGTTIFGNIHVLKIFTKKQNTLAEPSHSIRDVLTGIWKVGFGIELTRSPAWRSTGIQ